MATLARCSASTLTYPLDSLSTMDHSTTNSITSVLPVSSSAIENKESDNLTLDKVHPLTNAIILHGRPKAILRCNTTPFEERVLDLSTSQMVGRAVARVKPNSKNAIFDCKVLSRNHALLWYDNGKFYLQDTKSSNGTFVNSQRLSNANIESEPKEVFSSDVVQFGVDVVDNTRKVSHGCVVASLELILPSGVEAPKRSAYCNIDDIHNSSNDSADGQSVSGKNATQSQSCSTSCHPVWRSVSIPMYRIVELENSLKEALNRETDLECKLSTLQNALSNVVQATEKSWKSMVEEDRMLSRIELLENKLRVILTCNTYKTSDDKILYLKEQIDTLHNEREIYEAKAKESLLLCNNKFIQLNDKFTQIQGDLEHCKDENRRLTEVNSTFEKQLETLADAHEKALKEWDELNAKHKTCDETIIKLKSDIEMATSMGSTSTFTKSRELELEQQLAEMEQIMKQSQGEMKSEQSLRDQSEEKIRDLNDEISLLMKKLTELQDEHKLCAPIKLNGTADEGDASSSSVDKDDSLISDSTEPVDGTSTVDDSSLKMKCLLKQLDALSAQNEELTDKVQNLTSTVQVQINRHNELMSVHNKCLSESEGFKKQLVDQQTCHEESVAELNSRIVQLQLQLESEKEKSGEMIKSLKSTAVNPAPPPLTQVNSNTNSIRSTCTSDLNATATTPTRSITASTVRSSNSCDSSHSHSPALDNILEPARQIEDDDHVTSQLHLQEKDASPLPSRNIHNDVSSMANCLNSLESPDGIFIVYDLILATFFILLLYFGSPSVY